jgi:hypothetical protein
MAKELKIWNGRGVILNKSKLPPHVLFGRGDTHLYICAYSKADAARLINQFNGYEGDNARNYNSELTVYFSAGCWGIVMDGIERERGLWVTPDAYGVDKTPVRII